MQNQLNAIGINYKTKMLIVAFMLLFIFHESKGTGHEHSSKTVTSESPSTFLSLSPESQCPV